MSVTNVRINAALFIILLYALLIAFNFSVLRRVYTEKGPASGAYYFLSEKLCIFLFLGYEEERIGFVTPFTISAYMATVISSRKRIKWNE